MFWSMNFYYPAVAKCFSYQMKDDYVALGPFVFIVIIPCLLISYFWASFICSILVSLIEKM